SLLGSLPLPAAAGAAAGLAPPRAAGLAPGSCVATPPLPADVAPEQVPAATDAYNALTSVPVIPRTHAQVTALFGGLTLVAPGVVPVSEWRMPAGEAAPPCDVYVGGACVSRRGRRGPPPPPRQNRWRPPPGPGSASPSCTRSAGRR